MKKLTAGIFATILGLTAVDAFAAVPTGKYNVASVKYVNEAMKAAQTAATYDDTEVRGLISAADAKGAQGITDAAAAKAAADAAQAAAEAADAKAVAADGKAVAAQGEVDALEGKVGTVPEGTTVVKMIEDAQSEATYDDTEVRGLISAADAKGAQGITDAAAALAAAQAADIKAQKAQNEVDALDENVNANYVAWADVDDTYVASEYTF